MAEARVRLRRPAINVMMNDPAIRDLSQVERLLKLQRDNPQYPNIVITSISNERYYFHGKDHSKPRLRERFWCSLCLGDTFPNKPAMLKHFEAHDSTKARVDSIVSKRCDRCHKEAKWNPQQWASHNITCKLAPPQQQRKRIRPDNTMAVAVDVVPVVAAVVAAAEPVDAVMIVHKDDVDQLSLALVHEQLLAHESLFNDQQTFDFPPMMDGNEQSPFGMNNAVHDSALVNIHVQSHFGVNGDVHYSPFGSSPFINEHDAPNNISDSDDGSSDESKAMEEVVELNGANGPPVHRYIDGIIDNHDRQQEAKAARRRRPHPPAPRPNRRRRQAEEHHPVEVKVPPYIGEPRVVQSRAINPRYVYNYMDLDIGRRLDQPGVPTYEIIPPMKCPLGTYMLFCAVLRFRCVFISELI